MSQPLSLSAEARYATWPMWNMSITICWNGHSRAGLMVIGSCGWFGVKVTQVELLALKLRRDAFMPDQ